jgi:hypothetical protein
VIDLATDEETRLTKTDIGPIVPTGWSTDRRFLVVSVDRRRIGATASGRAIGLLPLAAAPDAEGDMKIVTLADDPNIGLHQPVMSPNDRWIAFIGPSFRLFVVGPSDRSWIRTYAQREWQLVAGDDSAPKDKPRWSVDGRLLYFTSARGGMLNVWAVAFDPASGPDGAPFKVTNFDGPGEQIPPVITAIEIAVTPDALLIPTERPTGGIWLVHPRR